MSAKALYPPMIAALLFTIAQSVQLMHRPDSIYIPIIFEAMLFAVGFILAWLFTNIIAVPLWKILALFSKHYLTGITISILFSALISYIFFNDDFYTKAKTFFGFFLPLASLMLISFYFTMMEANSDTVAKEQFAPDPGNDEK